MNDYLDPINSVGMAELVDSSLALDLLITVKETIRNYAIALTESSNTEVRLVIRKQMDLALDFQDEVINLMMKKKWFHPYDINEQKKLDLKAAQTALKLAKLKLFQEHSNRKGLYPTPPN